MLNLSTSQAGVDIPQQQFEIKQEQKLEILKNKTRRNISFVLSGIKNT